MQRFQQNLVDQDGKTVFLRFTEILCAAATDKIKRNQVFVMLRVKRLQRFGNAHQAIFNAFPWIGVSLECLAKKRIGMLTVRVDDVLQQMILGRKMVEEGLVGNIRFLDDGRDARAGNPFSANSFRAASVILSRNSDFRRSIRLTGAITAIVHSPALNILIL